MKQGLPTSRSILHFKILLKFLAQCICFVKKRGEKFINCLTLLKSVFFYLLFSGLYEILFPKTQRGLWADQHDLDSTSK